MQRLSSCRGIVDPACPLNWRNELNRGLIAEWSVIPNSGWSGGLTFRDLVRGGRSPNDGTLTNGPIFQNSRGRTGGYGSIKFDGINDVVTVTQNGRFNLHAGPLSIAAWVWDDTAVSSLSIARNVILWFDGTDCIAIKLTRDAGGTQREFGIQNSSGSSSVPAGAATSSVPLGWNHVAATYTGSAYAIYLNGKLSTGSATGNLNGFNGNSTTLYIGASGDGSRLITGNLDQIQVYNRCLSAQQVAALYAESKQGNPNRWNWISTRSYFLPLSITGTSRLLRTLLGAGV